MRSRSLSPRRLCNAPPSPNAYAKWESFAARIVAALTGADADLLTCPTDEVEVNEQTDGLTPRTRRAIHAVMQAFGVTNVGGFCPGGCRTGHIPNSDHYTGHAVDFMLTPINDANRQLGDAIAAWLVANANRLAVNYVIWNERTWNRGRASEGWRIYTHPSGSSGDTASHPDHPHLSVY